MTRSVIPAPRTASPVSAIPSPTTHGVQDGGAGPHPVTARLAELVTRLETAGQAIGFPAATLIDWEPLGEVFTSGLINNLGDPATVGLYPRQAKDLEQEAIDILADLLRAPAGDRWGYITAGAHEGVEWALRLARRRLPAGALVMHSRAAHPVVPDAADTLALPSIVLACDENGELDYADLETQTAMRRDRPMIVVATAGTTWSEAVDDVRRITAVLDRQQIPTGRRFVLVDTAFAGIPLALLDPADRPGFDLADGADAIVVSGHKFFGTPMPCAAVLTRRSLIPSTAPVGYTGGTHNTLSFSRNGHAAVALWYVLNILNRDRLAEIADAARDVARHLHHGLLALGWPAWRNPHAMTVVLDAPPELIRSRYRLTVVDGRSHLVCAPGITRTLVDTFIADLTAATRGTRVPAQTVPEPPPTQPGDDTTPPVNGVETGAGRGLLRRRGGNGAKP
jgi:histidine decarboxylase